MAERLSKRWRWALVLGVAIGVFSLSLAFLDLRQSGELVSFTVSGSQHVVAGRSTTVRVQAYREFIGKPGSRERVPVRVSSVMVDGRREPVRLDGDSPGRLHLKVPALGPPQRDYGLTLQAGSDEELITLSFEAFPPRPPSVLRSLPEIEPVRGVHRVDIQPYAGVVLAGMPNRSFVWVRSSKGVPVSGAALLIRHPVFEGGVISRQTDQNGLAEFSLQADQPSYRMTVEVDDGKEQSKHEELLRVWGRGMVLTSEDPVVGPGLVPSVLLRTWKERATIYCDLISDGSVIWATEVVTSKHQALIQLDAFDEGVYDFQCYSHPTVPGDSYATLPIIVSNTESEARLRHELRVRGNLVLKSLVSSDAYNERLQSFLTSHLLRSPTPIRQLLSTRPDAKRRLEATMAERESKLLVSIIGLALIVLLWVIDGVLRHIVRTRRQMRAMALELGADDGDEDATSSPDTLARTRGGMTAIVILMTLLLNVLGFLWVLTTAR